MKSKRAIVAATAVLIAACDNPASRLAEPTRVPMPTASLVLTPSYAQVVMRNLDNPRGLAIGPDGALFVAEAGRGGDGPCFAVMQTVCYGPTGAVSRLLHGRQERVITGLPSYANAAGRAEGPNGVSLLGNGGAYVTIGFETDPNARRQAPQLTGFARLVHISPTAFLPRKGSSSRRPDWEFVADLGSYEIATNPDCGRIDSNPFGLVSAPGRVIVAD